VERCLACEADSVGTVDVALFARPWHAGNTPCALYLPKAPLLILVYFTRKSAAR
jgi:hypothetical protein